MTGTQWKAYLTAGAVGTIMTGLLLLGGEDKQEVKFVSMKQAQRNVIIGSEIAKAKVGEEIVHLRGAKSLVFKADNGKLRTKLYTAPINYLDTEDSLYKPIDNSVKEISVLAKLNPLRKFDKYVDAGVYRATMKAETPHNYTMYSGDYSISYTALFDTVAVSTETKFSKRGVKQTYTFKDFKSVQDLKWLMSSNTVKQKNTDGSISYLDSLGKTVITTLAPYAWDSHFATVKVNVTVSGDTLIYHARVNEDTPFPVYVDPTSVVTTNEGWIRTESAAWATSRDATTGNLTTTGLWIGTSVVAKVYYVDRSFFSFAIPEMVSISACSLYLYTQGDYAAGFSVQTKSATSSTPLVNNDFNNFDGWAVSGDYAGSGLTIPKNEASLSSGWGYLVFNPVGRDTIFAKSASVLKLVAMADNDSSDDVPGGVNQLQFYSADESGKEPYLSMDYVPVLLTHPTDFNMTVVSSTSITADWTNNSVNYDSILVRNSPEKTAVGYAAAPTDTAVTIESLTPNTLYTWDAQADSNGIKGHSDPDFLYTWANAPTTWNFTNVGSTGKVDIGFNANSNPAGTLFAIRDSTSQQWVQSDGTLGATIDWDTYATWDALEITDPGTTGARRYTVKAKNGDDIETAELSGILNVYNMAPTGFTMTVLTSTSIQADWTNPVANYDSLLIMNDPEHTAVGYATTPTSTTFTKTGLTPNTLYTWFVRADSSGTKGDSDADSLYTLANPATTFAFVQASTLIEIIPAFNANSNPAATTYAIRDSTLHCWVAANGTESATAIWQTETVWEAIRIKGRQSAKTYIFGVVAKNGDGTETSYLWGSVTTVLATRSTAVQDGWLRTTNATYLTARNATTAGSISTAKLYVGQDSLGTTGYEVNRSFLQFALPEAIKTATACTLWVYGAVDSITGENAVNVVTASTYRPILTTADVDQFDGWASSGGYSGAVTSRLAPTWSTDGYTAGWISIVFTAAGLDTLLATAPDTLAIVLITNGDINGTAPDGGETAVHEKVAFYSSTESGKEPYLSFVYTSMAPTAFTVTAISTDSLRLKWTDNSADEDSFLIKDSYGNWIAAVDADVDSLRKGSLAVNTVYAYYIEVEGGSADGMITAIDSCYTLSNTPGLPTTTYPTQSIMKIVLNVNSNPAYTHFAIQDSISGYYVKRYTGGILDTLEASADWNTYAEWGGAAGCSLYINIGREYRIRVKARSTTN